MPLDPFGILATWTLAGALMVATGQGTEMAIDQVPAEVFQSASAFFPESSFSKASWQWDLSGPVYRLRGEDLLGQPVLFEGTAGDKARRIVRMMSVIELPEGMRKFVLNSDKPISRIRHVQVFGPNREEYRCEGPDEDGTTRLRFVFALAGRPR